MKKKQKNQINSNKHNKQLNNIPQIGWLFGFIAIIVGFFASRMPPSYTPFLDATVTFMRSGRSSSCCRLLITQIHYVNINFKCTAQSTAQHKMLSLDSLTLERRDCCANPESDNTGLVTYMLSASADDSDRGRRQLYASHSLEVICVIIPE